jgi:hypothetical protein
MKMTMRYAHLSPAFLSAEVSLLDPPKPRARVRKGQERAKENPAKTTGVSRRTMPGAALSIAVACSSP